MATGTNIKTYYDGRWHDGDKTVINAACLMACPPILRRIAPGSIGPPRR
jgi:hypothetical protein